MEIRSGFAEQRESRRRGNQSGSDPGPDVQHLGTGRWGNSFGWVGAKQEERGSFHVLDNEMLKGSFQTKPSFRESRGPMLGFGTGCGTQKCCGQPWLPTGG